MNQTAIAFSLMLSIGLSGCRQQEVAGPTPDITENIPPAETSPEELARRTEAFYERAMEDSSLIETTEYAELLDAHGPAFKRLLITKIQEADHITITEQSDQLDFLHPDGTLPLDPPRYEYGMIRLTDAQKNVFLEAVKTLDGRTARAVARCFQPHHRIHFVSRSGDLVRMLVCFECDRVIWDATGLTQPEGLFPALRSMMKAAGLETEKNWRQLARQRSEPAASGAAKPAH